MAVQQQKENYQRILDKTIEQLGKEGKVPSLLLHSCCAPCSSYVLEYLSEYFKITVLYYNPNISPKEEYEARVREQKRLIGEMDFTYPVSFLEGNYVPEDFYEMAKGHENDKEGGERCFLCYEMRLREAAEAAKMGIRLAKEYGIAYLMSDFKKKNGYKRSVELSAEHHLYRQDYCGCVFSKREAKLRDSISLTSPLRCNKI